MEFLFPVLLSIHLLVGLGVIGLVLLQHGKGADMGAAFGSGASGSLFGASGSANFLSRTTAALAAVFFITSLGLSYLSNSRPTAPASIMEAPLGVPDKGTTVVPLPGEQTPGAAEQKTGEGAQQKPAEAGAQTPSEATESKPAAGAADKDAAAAQKDTGVAPEKGTPAGGETKPAADAEAKPGQKPAESAAGKVEAKAETKAAAKAEKGAAAKKAGGDAPAAESKAKDIPK